MSLLDALLLESFPLDAWVAPRTDGVMGLGTEDDPYDGSTQGKFDAVMNTTLASSNNIRINLGPGIFQTLGYPTTGGWQPRTGWKITGAGMEVTTLQLVGAAIDNNLNLYLAIGGAYNNFLDGFEASDLTVDCNVSGQTSQRAACGAVGVVGAHNRLRRIRAINFGTQTTTVHRECFVLFPTEANYDLGSGRCIDCWLDACVLEQPGLQSTLESTLMGILSGENASKQMDYHRACVIRNCFVDCEYRINPVPIASIVISSGIATVTTRLPHGHANGDYVRITGADLNGSTNNSYNGSYQITNLNPPYGFTYQPSPTQTVNPTGDMWLGRFPSQYISIGNISSSGSGPYTITVTTSTPHFLSPGDTVRISNAQSSATPNPLNGAFSVSTVVSPTQFTYNVSTDPGTITHNGNEYTGVTFQGCSADGGTAAVVEGNRLFNLLFGGPYHDTWSSKDITVRNNYHRGVVSAPYQNMGGVNIPPQNALGLTHSGATATLTTSNPHALSVGQIVLMRGALNPFYNGYFYISSVPSPTSLTYEMSQDPGTPPGGTPQYQTLWTVGALVFENNIIELVLSIFGNGYDPPIGIDFYNGGGITPPIYLHNQALARRNVIRSLDGALDSSGYPIGIRPWSCSQAIVDESVIDLNSIWNGPPIWQIQCGSTAYLNNQTSAGALIQGWSHETQQYADEISTLIDLATVQAF